MRAAVTLRDALPGDAPAARALIGELGYPDVDVVAFERLFGELVAGGTVRIVLALVDGRAVGLMTLALRPQLRLAAPQVSIDELVVSDSARGSGVGGVLLDEAVRYARERGARRLELHTHRTRESYRRGFYIKRGFVEVESAVMRMEL